MYIQHPSLHHPLFSSSTYAHCIISAVVIVWRCLTAMAVTATTVTTCRCQRECQMYHDDFHRFVATTRRIRADRARLLFATTNGTPEIRNFILLCTPRCLCLRRMPPTRSVWHVNVILTLKRYFFVGFKQMCSHNKAVRLRTTHDIAFIDPHTTTRLKWLQKAKGVSDSSFASQIRPEANLNAIISLPTMAAAHKFIICSCSRSILGISY